jgi:hypothetical protein
MNAVTARSATIRSGCTLGSYGKCHGRAERRAYARDYFEREVPLDAVRAIYEGHPLDEALFAPLAPERPLGEMAEELGEIGVG